MKKLLSILLSLMMVVGLVPTAVFADEAAGAVPADMPETTAEEPVEEVVTEEAEVLESLNVDLSGFEIAGTLTLEASELTVALDEGEFKGILFTPEKDGNYFFVSENLYNADSDLIGVVYNYNSGEMLGIYDGGATGNNFSFTVNLKAGITYMLEVRQNGYGSDEFIISMEESEPVEDWYEISGALDFGTQTVAHNGDITVYSFTAPELDYYRFSADSFGGNSDCFLYNSGYFFESMFTDGNGRDFSFTRTVGAGETIYLAIQGNNFDTLDLTVEYEHMVVGVDDPPATCTTDGICHYTCTYCDYTKDVVIPASHSFEDGVCTVCGANKEYPYDAVANLGSNTVTIATDDIETNAVIYKFTADQAENYAFTSFSDEDDTRLELYDADMQQIGLCDDAEGWGLNFYLEQELEANQVVYLKISAYSACTFDFVVSKNHTYEWVVTKAPDCYNEGESTGTCKYCGATLTKTVPIQHSYNSDFTCDICGAGVGGSCGETATWNITGGVLTISGDGWTDDFANEDEVPWRDFKDAITKIVVEDGIETIGDYFFFGLDKVTEVVIADSVWDIHDYAFKNCSSLTSISVNADIGAHAFWGCDSLVNVNFGENVTGISDYAFSLCNSLTRVDFPDTVPSWSVGYGIYRECAALEEVYLPDNFDIIPPEMFSGCTALETVQLGRSLYSINWEAFKNCSNLKYITIPSGTSSIDEEAFANSGLETVMFGGSDLYIAENAFTGVTATAYYPAENAAGEWTEDELVGYGGNLTWTPWNYETIDSGSCGDNVTWRVDDAGRLFIEGTGAMYDYSGTNVPWYQYKDWVTTIQINEGITVIGENAFRCFRKYLSAVSFPSTLKVISENAFYGCEGLGCVIPSTVEHVADGAFYGCLLYMWEPDYAYGTSGDLKWEYTKSDFTLRFTGKGKMADYYEELPAWVEAAFPINSVVIGEGATSVGACAFSWMIDKFTVTLPSTVKTVEDGAFMFDTEVVIKFTGPAPALAEDAFTYADKIECIYPGKDTSYTKAYRSEYYGAFDISWTKFAQPDAPTITKNVNLADSGKIKLTWSKVDGAKKYQVYRSTSKTGTYSLMKTTTGTTYTNTNGKPNAYYYYYVVAIDDAGVMSPRSNVIGRRVDCAQPVVTAGNDAATGKPKLTWKAVDGAKEYKIYRATKQDGSYSLMKTTASTSYINSNAEVGKTYYYKVKAIGKNSASNSVDSAVRSRMCDLPRTKVTLSNVESSGKIKVSWTKVTGAVKYEVYRATSKNGTYSLKKTTTSLSWTDTNTTAGKTYYYQVKAIHTKSGANSAKTAYKYRMADLARPTVTTGLTSGGKPKLVWKEVTGAVKYQVYRSTSKNGTYTLMKTTTAKSWTDTGAKKGTRYYYKVRAVHSNTSANSAYSTVKYLTPTK